jgi:hypothetical protein
MSYADETFYLAYGDEPNFVNFVVFYPHIMVKTPYFGIQII